MVSVVMPAFNTAVTVAEAMDSVLRQTHADLELIVVDDGSTDSTAERARSICDPRLTLLQIPNSGPAAARNRGIQAAQGDSIVFLDADDIWLPAKLEIQLAALEERPAADAVYGFLDEVNAEGGNRKPLTRQLAEGRILETLLVWNVVGNGSNLLVRRSAFDAVGGFDESLGGAEDWELSARLASRCEFACVPQVLGLYRRLPNSLSSHLRRMERFYLRAHRKVYERAPLPLRRLRVLSLAVFYHYLAERGWTQGTWRIPAALRCSAKALFYAELAAARLDEPVFYPFAHPSLMTGRTHPVGAAWRSLFLRGEGRL